MGHAKENIMSDPNDVSNVFKWKEVRINITGTPEYDLSMAWVAIVREDGQEAPDLFIYVDDFLPTGPNAGECWRASMRAAIVCTPLGIQDNPQRRREVSRYTAPWAGSMV
jgi:hypothetical protein